VTGRLPPETENPVPVIESELIVTAAVPLEVTVIDFVIAVPTATLPNDSELGLRLTAGVAAFNCKAKLCDEPFAFAETVAVCDALTEVTLAVKVAADAPEATVTLAGTVTAALLLATFTLRPPDGAAELSERVHAVDPAPVNELVAHENALIEGKGADAAPLRLIDVVFATDPCVAVNATVWDDATADTFAAKLALVALEDTNTETGTVTALLLLARLTVKPLLGAGALNVTVHVSVPAPIIDGVAQPSPVSEASDEFDPFPCNFTPLVTFDDCTPTASTLSCPVESVAEPGLNRISTLML
jgi:hypothetical protein